MSMIAGVRWPLRERSPVPADLLLWLAWLVWVIGVAFVVVLGCQASGQRAGCGDGDGELTVTRAAAYHRATI